MSTPFDTIYKEHLPYVTRLARKLSSGDRDAADDLAQEAWLALHLTPQVHWSEPAYVRSVLTRAMHRWLRQEKRNQVVTLEDRPPSANPPRCNVLQFRRNTPRPHIQAIPSVPPHRRRAAA